MKIENQLRAVIYARLSEGSANTPAQVRRCRELAAAKGATVVAVEIDDDLTAMGKNGKRAPRPAYDRTVDHLVTGRADTVLCLHTDRLYRETRDLEPLIDVVKQTHAMIYPVEQSELDLTTETGRMVARMLAAVATYEVERARKRMLNKKEDNRLAGANPGGPRPFGYKSVKRHAKGETPEVQRLDPHEAELIRKAARDVLSGRTLSSIIREWNAAGVTTPFGKSWTISALRRVLTAARTAGKVEHQGEIIGDAQWPAIIDYPTMIALRNVLRDPARRVSADNRVKWLGSGIYKCVCGETLSIGKSQYGLPRYRCTVLGPGHVSRDAADLDEYVESELIEYLIRTGAVDVSAGPDTPEVDTPEIADLRTELARREEELNQLLAAPKPTTARAKIERTAYIEEAEQAVATVAGQIAEREIAASADTEPEDYGLGPEEFWPQQDIEQKRKILRNRVRVTVLPGRRGRRPASAPKLDPSLIKMEWAPHGQPFKD